VKEILVAKFKEVKTECKVAESSKESCGSKKGCFFDGDDDDTHHHHFLFTVSHANFC
jgi:hypothetical protein